MVDGHEINEQSMVQSLTEHYSGGPQSVVAPAPKPLGTYTHTDTQPYTKINTFLKNTTERMKRKAIEKKPYL